MDGIEKGGSDDRHWSQRMKVQLVSPLPDSGFAFNEGVYWPVGLLAVGSVLRRELPDVEVEILDEALIGREELVRSLDAEIVGIQASSNLTYRSVLSLALRAKEKCDALIVLGGPYASLMAPKILACRPFVDFVVCGPGELAMVEIVQKHRDKAAMRICDSNIGVCWREHGGELREPSSLSEWNYEEIRPLDYSLLDMERYQANYKRVFDDRRDYAFQIFTHFGCRYRDMRRAAGRNWCSYCALGEPLSVRPPEAVRDEIKQTLQTLGVVPGAKILLKCYGDNASAIGASLERLADVLALDPWLRKFDLKWSVYAQSCFVTPKLIEIFRKLGVCESYVGLDSVDDALQRLNGLGTSRATHLRAAELLSEAGIRLQLGFVLGCEGETPETLCATMDFCEELAKLGTVDLFHASPLVVLVGSRSFDMLAERLPNIRGLDYVDPAELQREWIQRFCPALGSGESGQTQLRRVAGTIADLGRLSSGFGDTNRIDEM